MGQSTWGVMRRGKAQGCRVSGGRARRLWLDSERASRPQWRMADMRQKEPLTERKVLAALNGTDFMAEAAVELGVSVRTLQRYMGKHGIEYVGRWVKR